MLLAAVISADVDNQQFTNGTPGEASGRGGSGKSIGYDDGAAKSTGDSGSGGGASLAGGSSLLNGPKGPEDNGPKIESDEDMPASSPAGGAPADAAIGGASADAGPKVGYDYEAPKGRVGETSGGGLSSPGVTPGFNPKVGGSAPVGGPAPIPKDVFRRGDKVAKKKNRSRGASLKRGRNSLSRGPSAFGQRTDVLISTRPPPDFQVEQDDPNYVD